MLIDLSIEARDQQQMIISALGQDEILSQCCEECCELGHATQKVRRVLCGTTPLSMGEALEKLIEETGDVLLLLDYLECAGLLDLEEAVKSAKQKNTRWYERTFGS